MRAQLDLGGKDTTRQIYAGLGTFIPAIQLRARNWDINTALAKRSPAVHSFVIDIRCISLETPLLNQVTMYSATN